MTKYRRKKYENFSLFDFIVALVFVLSAIVFGVWTIVALTSMLVSGLINVVISVIGFL